MPDSTLSKLEVFIGTWNTTGEVLETAVNGAGTLVATDTYRWLPGKHFIVHDVDARFDGKPTRSMEVIGFDSAHRRLVSRSYDDQGSTEEFVVALDGRRWTIKGEKVRFEGSFDTKRSRLSGLWELKTRKSRWEPWIQLKLVRS